MPFDDIASLKSSIAIYEKELQKASNFLVELKKPANEIKDAEISAAIRTPSALRLLELYEKLLDSYRNYVKELERKLG
jgi:vacuolar-type H+-ATPase subunit E/Vma4